MTFDICVLPKGEATECLISPAALQKLNVNMTVLLT